MTDTLRRRWGSRAFAVLTAGLLGLGAGCHGRRAGDDKAAIDSPIEMFSWWERIGDSDALGALVRQHRTTYPNDAVMNATAGLSGLARKTLRARMLRNDPPDTFQANAGQDLMQWVLLNGMDAGESKLLPLDGVLPEVAEWRRTIPPAVIEHVSWDGKMYGVPANLQRINSVFFNKAVLDKYGIVEPHTLKDLLAAGRKLHDNGMPLFAVGSREPWTLELLFFESLLVSREGPDVYRDYFRGRLKPDDPRIVANLRAALELARYINPDHDRLSWLQAMDRVIAGQAAMTAMGDWARVSLTSRGLVIGRDFGEMAFPGTENVMVFTSDSFSLPHDAKNPAGARRLLATIGSVDGQRATNGARQTLSARVDAPPPASDPTLMAKYQLVKEGRLVLALSGMLPRLVDDDLGAALSEMLTEGDPEPAVETLRSRYALLK